MHPLLQSLSGGDRRSIGHAGRAVQAVLAHPEWLAVLFEGIEAPDPVLRMRCADAIEKITARRPALLPDITRHLAELAATGTPAMKARGHKLLRVLRKEFPA
jgi:hypothetical protein